MFVNAVKVQRINLDPQILYKRCSFVPSPPFGFLFRMKHSGRMSSHPKLTGSSSRADAREQQQPGLYAELLYDQAPQYAFGYQTAPIPKQVLYWFRQTQMRLAVWWAILWSPVTIRFCIHVYSHTPSCAPLKIPTNSGLRAATRLSYPHR